MSRPAIRQFRVRTSNDSSWRTLRSSPAGHTTASKSGRRPPWIASRAGRTSLKQRAAAWRVGSPRAAHIRMAHATSAPVLWLNRRRPPDTRNPVLLNRGDRFESPRRSMSIFASTSSEPPIAVLLSSCRPIRSSRDRRHVAHVTTTKSPSLLLTCSGSPTPHCRSRQSEPARHPDRPARPPRRGISAYIDMLWDQSDPRNSTRQPDGPRSDRESAVGSAPRSADSPSRLPNRRSRRTRPCPPSPRPSDTAGWSLVADTWFARVYCTNGRTRTVPLRGHTACQRSPDPRKREPEVAQFEDRLVLAFGAGVHAHVEHNTASNLASVRTARNRR